MLISIIILGFVVFGTGFYLHLRARQRAERDTRWAADEATPRMFHDSDWTPNPTGQRGATRAVVFADDYPTSRVWPAPNAIMGLTSVDTSVFTDDDDDDNLAPIFPAIDTSPTSQDPTSDFVPGGAPQGFGGGGASGDWVDPTPAPDPSYSAPEPDRYSAPEPSYSAPDPTPDYSSDPGSSGD